MRPTNGRLSADDVDSDYEDSDPRHVTLEVEPSGTLNLSMGSTRKLVTNQIEPPVSAARSGAGPSFEGVAAIAGEATARSLSGTSAPPRKTGFSIEEIMRR